MQPSNTQPALRGRTATLHLDLLAEVAICVAPAMAAVAWGSPDHGSKWLFGTLCVLLAWHVAIRNPAGYLTLLAGAIPAAMLLRDYFAFSSVTILLLAGLLLWFALRPGEFRRFGRNLPLVGFVAGAALYWWLSYVFTGVYTSNLRALELAFSATAVFLLGSRRSHLGTALVGIGLSTVAVGLGLAPYGHRLGMAEIGNTSLGNPITLGLPAALVLLLAIAQGGQWLLASANPLARAAIIMATGACLLLSTARGSWLVAAAGFVAVFACTRRKRLALLLPLVPLAIAGVMVMASGRGEFVSMYLNRALDSDRSLAQRTTGRFKQWAAAPDILAGSPVWGYGPGTGLSTNIRFTGSHKAWHSLYLQVAVESGGLGLAILALLFAALIVRGLRHRRATGDVVPLMGSLCFMAIALSVSGLDAISGVFLGLGFLAQDFTGMYVMREFVVAAPAREYAAPVTAA